MGGRIHAFAVVASWAGFAASALLLVVALPVAALVQALQDWTQGLGLLAPLAFAALYGVATTVLVPGSALSLGAGVLFGVWLGTAVVWTGATAAIVVSFLIARHAARARVEALAATRPRFAAVDGAVGEQGWKIVALMRLSPLFPFGLQNYFFGITAIGFWPYCIASAACIVPGTFLYVYLGYAGGEAAVAVGAGGRAGMLRLGLQLVGLLATIAVSWYVAHTAARAIAKHAAVRVSAPAPKAAANPATRSPFRTACTLAAAAACLAASLLVFSRREVIRSVLLSQSGPAIQMRGAVAVSRSFAANPVAGRLSAPQQSTRHNSPPRIEEED